MANIRKQGSKGSVHKITKICGKLREKYIRATFHDIMQIHTHRIISV